MSSKTLASLVFLIAPATFAQVSVLTYHNDMARTGLNNQEKRLTPSTVNATGFGKQFSMAVDGKLLAQPLYVPALDIPGKGFHNVVFLATGHDSVYAFDADSNFGPNAQPLWHVSLLPAQATTMPTSDFGCGQITPEVGITSTPVIDASAGTMFVVAASKENGAYVHRLHALDILSGAERPNSPVVVQPTVTNSHGTQIHFDPFRQVSRPALLLLKGTVFTSWGSHCDQQSAAEPYFGWLVGYNASSLAQTLAFNVTPDGSQGAVWNAGSGPASDGRNVYFATGNGTADAAHNFGDSVVKMDPATGAVLDFFTPNNQFFLSLLDQDLGSGGFMLFPTGNTAVPVAGIVAGKQGTMYLMDAANLGGFHSPDAVKQFIPGAINPSFGAPAYFNGAIYYAGTFDHLKRFALQSGAAAIDPTPTSMSSETFAHPGATPFISSDGNVNGIVWALENAQNQFKLHAYAAADLTNELYTSPALGRAVSFTTGAVADGKVFVPGNGTATVLTLITPGCVGDSSSAVTIARSRFYYIAARKIFAQAIVVTNTSPAALPAPISIAILNLTSGVTLAGATGTAVCQGIAGAPYVNLPAGLAAGESAQVVLQFSDPLGKPVYYNPVTVSGAGNR